MQFTEVIADVHYESSNTSVSEKELVYTLYLEEGKPKTDFVGIENANNTNTEGILECIKELFHRLGITNFSKKLVGLNVDGVNVNTGQHTGLGTRIKSLTSWLQVIHCFNHSLELALKDAFSQSPAFSSVDSFIVKLYYLYQMSPKRLRHLHKLTDAQEKSVPKPTKAGGTRWLDFKYNAIKNAL